ncbi:MAG: hypothetical protein DI568_16850 [Sphingomonas sp.]|nr:MAG: hypothetical protein DI568_16850 [Sphingomonas sp.]
MLTVKQLSQSTGWPEGRIRKLAKTRRLAHVRLGGMTLLPANAIDIFLQQNMVEPDCDGSGFSPRPAA